MSHTSRPVSAIENVSDEETQPHCSLSQATSRASSPNIESTCPCELESDVTTLEGQNSSLLPAIHSTGAPQWPPLSPPSSSTEPIEPSVTCGEGSGIADQSPTSSHEADPSGTTTGESTSEKVGRTIAPRLPIRQSLGILGCIAIGGGTAFLFGAIGFFSFLWAGKELSGNSPNAVWLSIMLNGWATQAIALSCLIIRIVVAAQARPDTGRYEERMTAETSPKFCTSG